MLSEITVAWSTIVVLRVENVYIVPKGALSSDKGDVRSQYLPDLPLPSLSVLTVYQAWFRSGQ